jgi:hypothetical protein
MLSIKHWYNKFFNKNNTIPQKTINNKICKIELSLSNDFDMDVFIEFDNLEINSIEKYNLYTEKIAYFLNTINSEHVTYNIAKLIIEDIGSNKEYTQFSNDIIKYWTILEKEKENQAKEKHLNAPLIRPIEVFSKYYNTK